MTSTAVSRRGRRLRGRRVRRDDRSEHECLDLVGDALRVPTLAAGPRLNKSSDLFELADCGLATRPSLHLVECPDEGAAFVIRAAEPFCERVEDGEQTVAGVGARRSTVASSQSTVQRRRRSRRNASTSASFEGKW